MKKRIFQFLVLVTLFFQFLTSEAQVRRYYCEIIGNEKILTGKTFVTFDFGQDFSYDPMEDVYPERYIVDRNGKSIAFNSMVDAMNYMSERGWILQQIYTANGSGIAHWVLYKEASSKEEAKGDILTDLDFEE